MDSWRRYSHPKVYQYNSKPQRRKQKVKFSFRVPGWIIWLVLIIGVIGGFVWFIFWSDYWTVHQVVLQGEMTDPVKTTLEQLQGKKILFLSEDEILKEAQAADSAVASVQLTKGFPDQVRVTVTRLHPAMVWQTGETKWAIDASGVAFPIDATLSVDGMLPVVDLKQQKVEADQALVAPEFVQFIQAAYQKLPETLGGKLQRAEIDETTFYVRFVTEWNWVVILDTTRPLQGQLDNLSLALKDHRGDIHEYIDMRLNGKAYIK